MPAIARQLSHHAPPKQAAPATLAIRWEIGTEALLLSPGAAILNGQAAKLRACALVIRVAGGSARAELDLDLTTGEKSVIVLGSPATVERNVGEAVMSLEAVGVLSLTIRGDDVLYARTPVLERVLGLPGGVYDAPVRG